MRSAELWQPPLEEAADALQQGLEHCYADVSVSIEVPLDLREWGCAKPGMTGSTAIVEVGGEAYAHNRKYRDVQFSIAEIAEQCGRPRAELFGAGMASPAELASHCGEMIASYGLPHTNLSRVARVGPTKESIAEDYPSWVHSGLANLYLCDGLPGPAIRIDVARRTGSEASLTQAMRWAFNQHMDPGGARQIALGGLFRITAGRVRSHIMPDYDCIGFEYFDAAKNEAFRDFLQFYEMGPDLLCFSVMWTGDPTGGALHLRPSGEHTHFYASQDSPEAGHYHGDVTPEGVAYTGYFHPAERVFRVNDPDDLKSTP